MFTLTSCPVKVTQDYFAKPEMDPFGTFKSHSFKNEHLFSKAGQPFNSLSFSRSSLFGGKRTLPLGIKILKTVIRSALIYSLLFCFV